MLRMFGILPPAACYALAATVMISTVVLYEGYFDTQKAQKAALEADPPVAVSISDYDGQPTATGEVALEVQLRADLTQSTQITTGAGVEAAVISYLVTPSASALGDTVHGVVVVPAAQVTQFTAWLNENITGKGPQSPVFAINGKIRDVPDALGRDIDLVLIEREMRKSENFAVITPFVGGRAVYLAPDPIDYRGYVIGGIVALLLGFLGFQRSLEDRRAQGPRVSSDEVLSKLTPMEPGTADRQVAKPTPRVTSKADPDSPLGRIQAKARSDALEF